MRALVLSVLLSQSAAAESFLGFSLDSTTAVTLVETRVVKYADDAEDGSDYTESTLSVWTVWDLRSGAATSYSDETKFQAWLETHELAPVKLSRKSPDGKAKAEVHFDPDVGAGTWSKEAWTSDANWTLAITRGGKTRAVEHCSGATSIDVSWSPDGKHTAWNINHYYPEFQIRGLSQGGTQTTVLIASEDSLAISVAAPTRDQGRAAAATLKKASYADAAISIALKKRAATVIYFAKEQKVVAEQLVALFPGSSVAPMDWNAPFDVVVALGSK